MARQGTRMALLLAARFLQTLKTDPAAAMDLPCCLGFLARIHVYGPEKTAALWAARVMPAFQQAFQMHLEHSGYTQVLLRVLTACILAVRPLPNALTLTVTQDIMSTCMTLIFETVVRLPPMPPPELKAYSEALTRAVAVCISAALPTSEAAACRLYSNIFNSALIYLDPDMEDWRLQSVLIIVTLLVEHSVPAIVPHMKDLGPPLTQLLEHACPIIRRRSLYLVSILASRCEEPVLLEWCLGVAPLLERTAAAWPPRGDALGEFVRETAVVALVNLAATPAANIAVADFLPMLLTWLPIRRNMELAHTVYRYVVGALEDKHPVLLQPEALAHAMSCICETLQATEGGVVDPLELRFFSAVGSLDESLRQAAVGNMWPATREWLLQTWDTYF